MKYFIVLFSFLFSSINCVRAEDTSNPKEAWVAFATSDYFALMEVMIASVHAFSTRPIMAVGINADIPFSTVTYPHLIKKRVDVPFHRSTIFNQKPRCILESGLDYGIYIEADDVLNAGCDSLFEYAHLERPYPLCPTHPDDPNDQHKLMSTLGVPAKTMHYVHGHVIFSKQCMPFVQEWYETCLLYAHEAPNYDETVLNVLLWKHAVQEQVPTYDPWCENIHTYLSLTASQVAIPSYCYWMMFHGHKNPTTGWNMLNQLKKRNQLVFP